MEEAFGYIDRYNRTRAEFSGLDRFDMRDYSFSGAILIRIFAANFPLLSANEPYAPRSYAPFINLAYAGDGALYVENSLPT